MDSTISSNSNQNLKSSRKYGELDSIDFKLWKRTDRFLINNDPNGTDVFIITNSDDVFAYGCNYRGRLGFGHKEEVKEPKIIPELCRKSVKDIKSGFVFSVALTESGHIYTFGSNKYGGTGDEDNGNHKPIPIPVDDQLIAAIDCGNRTTYLLTQTGQLYWFGFCLNAVSVPTKVVFPYNTKVKSISCALNHIFALTVDGKVFSWGDNSFGQLGLGHNDYTESPKMIYFGENVSIGQISCGYNHSLILTSNGNLYSMGCNDFGQLGIGRKVNKTRPQLVLSEQKEICCYEDMSMSIDVNNRLYIWGNIGNKVIFPVISELTSFQEVVNTFAKYRSTIGLTLKPIKPISSLTKIMINAFNNPKNSDLKFKIKCIGTDTQFKYIYCHKWFIEESSEYFKTMFANNWSENTTNEIKITSYSFDAYYHYIKSLYTDSIDCEDIEILSEVLSITDEYMDSNTKDKCLELIKELSNIENICSVYSNAIKYSSECLRQFAFEVMSQSMDQVIDTTDFKNMELIFLQELFAHYIRSQEN